MNSFPPPEITTNIILIWTTNAKNCKIPCKIMENLKFSKECSSIIWGGWPPANFDILLIEERWYRRKTTTSKFQSPLPPTFSTQQNIIHINFMWFSMDNSSKSYYIAQIFHYFQDVSSIHSPHMMEEIFQSFSSSFHMEQFHQKP